MYWLYVFVIINALFMLYLMLSLMFIVDFLCFIVLACAAALMYCRLYDVFALMYAFWLLCCTMYACECVRNAPRAPLRGGLCAL